MRLTIKTVDGAVTIVNDQAWNKEDVEAYLESVKDFFPRHMTMTNFNRDVGKEFAHLFNTDHVVSVSVENNLNA